MSSNHPEEKADPHETKEISGNNRGDVKDQDAEISDLSESDELSAKRRRLDKYEQMMIERAWRTTKCDELLIPEWDDSKGTLQLKTLRLSKYRHFSPDVRAIIEGYLYDFQQIYHRRWDVIYGNNPILSGDDEYFSDEWMRDWYNQSAGFVWAYERCGLINWAMHKDEAVAGFYQVNDPFQEPLWRFHGFCNPGAFSLAQEELREEYNERWNTWGFGPTMVMFGEATTRPRATSSSSQSSSSSSTSSSSSSSPPSI
jgi:hypothetical protein